MQGVKGEAVVRLRRTLNTQLVRSRTGGEMRYDRLSRRVNNSANRKRFLDLTICEIV